MVWVDFLLIAIILISCLISLIRGFVKEAISLATWAAAVALSLSFADKLAAILPESLAQPSLRLGIAFVALFIATMAVGGLVKFLIGALIDKTGLSGTDRTIGAGFGLLRGVLIICVLVILGGLTPMPQDPWWQESVLLPYFIDLVHWIKPILPHVLVQYINV